MSKRVKCYLAEPLAFELEYYMSESSKNRPKIRLGRNVIPSKG
jgi:hypothetical protein